MEPDGSRSGVGSIVRWRMIVPELSRIVGRPVIDETGLKGAWRWGAIRGRRVLLQSRSSWDLGSMRVRGRWISW
jgi:hypothetical protein